MRSAERSARPKASGSTSSACCARAWRTPRRGIPCGVWTRSSACSCKSRGATMRAVTRDSRICSRPLWPTTSKKRTMSAHTAQTQLQLVGKLVLSGELHCETGLHIGAGKGSLEIGGADNPVVKDAFGLPYIPGSSLRGKVRSLLENAMGLTSPAELVYLSKRRGQEVRIHQSYRPDDDICLLFAPSPRPPA